MVMTASLSLIYGLGGAKDIFYSSLGEEFCDYIDSWGGTIGLDETAYALRSNKTTLLSNTSSDLAGWLNVYSSVTRAFF